MNFDEVVEFLNYLADKYSFDEADIASVQELIYGLEKPEELYGTEEEIIYEPEEE